MKICRRFMLKGIRPWACLMSCLIILKSSSHVKITLIWGVPKKANTGETSGYYMHFLRLLKFACYLMEFCDRTVGCYDYTQPALICAVSNVANPFIQVLDLQRSMARPN